MMVCCCSVVSVSASSVIHWQRARMPFSIRVCPWGVKASRLERAVGRVFAAFDQTQLHQAVNGLAGGGVLLTPMSSPMPEMPQFVP